MELSLHFFLCFLKGRITARVIAKRQIIHSKPSMKEGDKSVTVSVIVSINGGGELVVEGGGEVVVEGGGEVVVEGGDEVVVGTRSDIVKNSENSKSQSP